jgi:DNA-binding LacI/PurR family transcriptional regulator
VSQPHVDGARTRGNPGSRQPRMIDVACLAGVSHQTVSRVLNDSASVRPEIRRRVQEAITTLGYRRNVAARQLASGRSRVVGLVVNDVTQFGPASVALGIQTAAADTPYTVSTIALAETSAQGFQAAVEPLLGQSVEALIVLVRSRQVLDLTRTLDVGIPILAVDGDPSDLPLTVGIDQAEGARLATRHLVELGHRHIAHLAGPADSSESVARRLGWRTELRNAGLPAPRVRLTGDWSARSGHEAATLLVAHEPQVTAVFAANDQMALGLIHGLRESGRSVPGDVSVVGFDDLPESAYFSPSLTTVRQDFTELGRRAMCLIERVLSGETSQQSPRLVPAQLVIRDSTLPPRHER